MSYSTGWLMTCIAVRWLHGQSEPRVTRGTTRRGRQRSVCQNTTCPRGRLLLDDRNRGCVPAVKHHIIAMRLNTSEVRDTARVRRLSTYHVRSALQKKAGMRMQRLVRTAIGFSTLTQLHDIIIGVLVNRSACGRAVYT